MKPVFATLVKFGTNSQAIWEFAAAVLVVQLIAVIAVAGVALVKRLVNGL